MKTKLINDEQTLVSAKSRHGHSIPVYDDGCGALYISRDSMGINGIVRADSWEDAYSICEDEFFPECDQTIEELRKEYNKTRRSVKMVKTLDGMEREDCPDDYKTGKLAGVTFSRWQTIETPSEDENAWMENDLFCEAFGFRPNGPNESDALKHGIYAKDLNGDYLDILTPALLAELEIKLGIVTNE